MCGIAGVFLTSRESPGQRLSIMLDTIRHRGYSNQEVHSEDQWAIGANRLQIVDRDNGRQPFFSNDGNICAVLNGEIYNYRELRQELELLGCRFSTLVDTEVIAHGYRQWGDALFDRLDGMFAIIVHDNTDNSYRAARDPLGVKPLYRAVTPEGCFMASEIKALLHLNAEIEELPPGHYVEHRSLIKPFATLPAVQASDNLSDNARRLQQLLSQSVRKRVDTDLHVAVFLSGGIDSSAVMYEAVRHHPEVTGFTIGLDEASDVLAAKRLCSESDYRLKHIRVMEQELIALITETIWTIESFEPNHIRGGVLSYILSREASRGGFRVALCGEGADELFGGYREFALSLARGESADTIQGLMSQFIAELYKTQLKRVDRTSMRFTLEMREPFLDKLIVSFASSIPFAHKLAMRSDGGIANKSVLREAYRGLLPDWLVAREKDVLSLGAGFGSNGPEGMFYLHGQDMVSEDEFTDLRARYPAYMLRNREEAYYFKIFHRLFGDQSIARQRPTVNATPAGV
jgi:asparagine synthase (glutamine-hydrolysing)